MCLNYVLTVFKLTISCRYSDKKSLTCSQIHYGTPRHRHPLLQQPLQWHVALNARGFIMPSFMSTSYAYGNVRINAGIWLGRRLRPIRRLRLLDSFKASLERLKHAVQTGLLLQTETDCGRHGSF